MRLITLRDLLVTGETPRVFHFSYFSTCHFRFAISRPVSRWIVHVTDDFPRKNSWFRPNRQRLQTLPNVWRWVLLHTKRQLECIVCETSIFAHLHTASRIEEGNMLDINWLQVAKVLMTSCILCKIRVIVLWPFSIQNWFICSSIWNWIVYALEANIDNEDSPTALART